MLSRHRPIAGFSLLELLLVMAIVGIAAAVVLSSIQPAAYDDLRSTAQIVATDLAYARSLAVANNSSYRVTFDLAGNSYTLVHSGANPALTQLPKTPFASPGDPADKHIVRLVDLPHMGTGVRLAAVASTGTTVSSTDNVEFGPLGQTTRTDPTTVWLAISSGDDRRYITLVVNPVTGLVETGAFSKTPPPASITQVP